MRFVLIIHSSNGICQEWLTTGQEARKAARRHGLNPDIFERQINQESGFAPDVISGRRKSSAGAQGIAQFMPATARGMGVNPLNPTQALDGAARLMSSYVKKYGNYRDA
jgi:soluble lytic murein transglycosylase-like protein